MVAPEAIQADFNYRMHGTPLGFVERLAGENRKISLISDEFITTDPEHRMFRESPEAKALGLAEEVIRGDGRNGFEVIKWKKRFPEDDDESGIRTWITEYGIDIKLPWVRSDVSVRTALTSLLGVLNNKLVATEDALDRGISYIPPEGVIASKFISSAAEKLKEELAQIEVMNRIHEDTTDPKVFHRSLTWREADLAVHYANELGHQYGLQFKLWETHPNPEQVTDSDNAMVTIEKRITYGITLSQKWPHGIAPLVDRMDALSKEFLHFIQEGNLIRGNSLHLTDAGQKAASLALDQAYHIATVLQKSTPVA